MERLHKEAAVRQATTAELERLQREVAALKANQPLNGPFLNGDSAAKNPQLEQKITLLEQQVETLFFGLSWLHFSFKRY
jgi:hypothetical protein